ncbi:MAG: GAF domain-containing protein [Chloroflexi bacterium]|nr:GAF domain-containing protein [Chloroflexota bacterium]
MRSTYRFIAVITACLIALAALIVLTVAQPIRIPGTLPVFLFGFLIAFTMTFGIALAGGVISFLPMVVTAAYLTMGMAATGWLIFVGAGINGLVRHFFGKRLQLPFSSKNWPDLLSRVAVNAVMTVASVLFGGYIFERLGGSPPLSRLGSSVLLLAFVVGYFLINYFFAGIYLSMMGGGQYKQFLRTIPQAALYEATPVAFAPLIALVYTVLGEGYFALLVLAMVIVTIVMWNLNKTRLHLNRRVRELDSLQVVGQTLSASLEIEAIAAAIHSQVARLMPAGAFYIALYEPESGEVSFPLSYVGSACVQWSARRAGNGLTEYVLRTRRPLLIREDVGETAVAFGLDLIGKESACWLGVPIMLAEQPIGVIAVQSYSRSNVYDDWHQDVLVTIAAQAAMAIQNARLYTRAGSALAQRVQELDSILRTTHDGILLCDRQWRILTTNRAFIEFVGLENVDLTGQSLMDWSNAVDALIANTGYTPTMLEEDGDALLQGEKLRRRSIVVSGPPERHVERTLVPVHNQERKITGWLLIFRDTTEEVELLQMRDDMAHMVVHDLRSPLSVTLGSLETIRAWLEMGRMEDVHRLLELAKTGGERMLQLLNDLLDTYKFESGEMPLDLAPMPILPWLTEAKAQFLPIAAETGIMITVDIELNLPPVVADKEHMTRILSNLVDNAVKFTPDGGDIRLWAQVATEANSPMVLVGVSDTGVGIPLEEQDKLFIKFQQNMLTKGRRQGTGLGLTYCKLVVEAHGGRIWVESSGTKGGGSTFMMEFPAYVG